MGACARTHILPMLQPWRANMRSAHACPCLPICVHSRSYEKAPQSPSVGFHCVDGSGAQDEHMRRCCCCSSQAAGSKLASSFGRLKLDLPTALKQNEARDRPTKRPLRISRRFAVGQDSSMRVPRSITLPRTPASLPPDILHDFGLTSP